METSGFVTQEELINVLKAQYEWMAKMALNLQSVLNILLMQNIVTMDQWNQVFVTTQKTAQGKQIEAIREKLRHSKTVEEYLKEFQGTVQ